MMLTCYVCKQKLENVKKLLYHIRKTCLRYSVLALGYRCGEVGCFRNFSDINSFRRHVKTHLLLLKVTTENKQIIAKEHTDMKSKIVKKNLHIGTSNVDETLLHQTSSFVASLYKNPIIPRSTVQIVIQEMQKFHISLSETLRQKFQSHFSNENFTDDISVGVDDMLSLLNNSMSPFRSEFKRLQYFTTLGTYIPPIETIIGHRVDTRLQHNQCALRTRPCIMQIIPLSLVLQFFFSIEAVWLETTNYLKYLSNNSKLSEENPNIKLAIENVIQGSVWQKNYTSHVVHNNPITLPIVIFYDEFEAGNALGSHVGIHKLGGIYVSLPALPPHLFSLLSNIFLLAICHSSDKSKFGNKAIFTPVIEQLNFLQNTGIKVNNKFFDGTVKFKVVAITGDNLGLNSILGFTESFSANFCCRICNANKSDLQTMTFENISLLRDMNSYREQILQNDLSRTGIREECCWFALKEFDLFENVAVDLMHDLLEGVARYTMTYVINHFIDIKLLNSHILQEKLASFDYGPDASSKPCNCIIIEVSRVKIKTSAAEMLTLIRYFGLLVGSYIPIGHEVWHLYLSLRTIVDRLLSHRIYSDTIEQMKWMISEFNQLYCKLTGEPLKPKFHFLIHYPVMLMKFGPLCHLWTMRFEAKHRILKIAARASCSKINICKTIAIKNQLILNDLFLKQTISFQMECGKKTVLDQATVDKFHVGYNVFAKYSVTWVKLKGVVWRLNNVFTIDIGEDTLLPVFGLIDTILITETGEVYFHCLLLNSLSFDTHYHAYEVVRTRQLQCVSHKDAIALTQTH